MQHGSKTSNQQGFSIIELMVALVIMLIVGGAVFALMRDSLKITVATYELTDAQENLRLAQEFVNRDLLNAGDGLKSLTTIRLPQAFVTNYLTRAPVPATPGIINLGIITSDNNVPAGIAVPLAIPAATYRTNTDRQTILEIDYTFTPLTLPSIPRAINPAGSTITVPAAYPIGSFTAGEIYFLTSGVGRTFGTITSIDVANRRLNFANGDVYGLNLSGNGGHIWTISTAGTLPTSLQRMKIIHYYVTSTGLLMRRVFGAKCSPAPAVCAGFREGPVAENIVNVQFNYSMVTIDASGNVIPSTSATLTPDQERGVRQVEVKITAETPRELQNGQKHQLTTTTSTSIRNMQFRQAQQP